MYRLPARQDVMATFAHSLSQVSNSKSFRKAIRSSFLLGIRTAQELHNNDLLAT